jgi:hypothetical protein
MRLEHLPLLLGLLVGALGLALVLDAIIPDGTFGSRERRKRERPERHRGGELALGAGVLLLAASLLGRDTWRYTNLAMLIAMLLFIAGVALNYRYVRGLMFGPVVGDHLKRREVDKQQRKKPRIR